MNKRKPIKKVIKKVKKPIKVESKIEPELFSVIFKSGGQEYKAEALDLYEALQKINVPYPYWKGKGLVSVRKGELSAERTIFPMQMRKLWRGNKLQKLILAKMLLSKCLKQNQK